MILDDLVAATKERLQREQQSQPLAQVKATALATPKPNPDLVYERFLSPGMHIIGEVKRASPSKGLIAKDFPYRQIAEDYAAAGVTAISVLTEPKYFQGRREYLAEIAKRVATPVLKKDFIIDPYMLYQARVDGARIVLLIVAILTDEQLTQYLNLAHQLGLAVLVEAHDPAEIKTAIDAGAKMIGVNNRNLKNFTVSFENSIRLRPLVPRSIAFIAESGVKSVADVHTLAQIGVNGALIGETLMRSTDRAGFIRDALGDD